MMSKCKKCGNKLCIYRFMMFIRRILYFLGRIKESDQEAMNKAQGKI